MITPPHNPQIEGFWIRNYKVLRQIAIGSSFQQSVVMDFVGEVVPYELAPLTILVGDTGTGKSTILDAFAFLADCINLGIQDAIENRGGFESIYHFGGTGPISIGIVYRPCGEPRSLTYILNIDWNKSTYYPFVETEAIFYRDHQPGSQPYPVLLFRNGDNPTRLIQPWVDINGTAFDQAKRTNSMHLGLTSLAQIEVLPDIPQFKQYLDRFSISCYISSNAASLSPPNFKCVPAGNLAGDLKRFKDKHPLEFNNIMDVIARKMPGVAKINMGTPKPGQTILSFNMQGNDATVYPAQMGEGSLRLLSHLLLFEDPIPTPLLGIEEPTAFMGISQIKAFVELIQHHIRELGGTQFLVTTSNNTLIDHMDPTDVWFLFRDKAGSIRVSRGLDELQFFGVDMNTIGPYWYSEYLYRDKTSPESARAHIQSSSVVSM